MLRSNRALPLANVPMRCPILILMLLAMHASGGAADGEAAPERWVERLGSESWHEREEAATKLLALGDEARPLVERALESGDPEVRERARTILLRLRWAPPAGLSNPLAGAFAHYHSLPESQRVTLLSKVTSELRERAVPLVLRVLRHDPSERVRQQALSRLQRLDAGAAEKEMRAMIAKEENANWARTQLAQVLASQGKLDEAIAVYERAWAQDPKIEDRVLHALARLCERQEKWAKARDAYIELLSRDGTSRRRYASKLGFCHYQLGQRDKAEAVWDQMLEDLGESPEAYQELARVYESTGAKDRALDVLRRGARKHPHDFGILRTLGQKLALYGKVDEAVGVLHRAQEAAPAHYQTRMVNMDLVRILRQKGELDAYQKRVLGDLGKLRGQVATRLRTLAERQLAARDIPGARKSLERLHTIFPLSGNAKWAAEQLERLDRVN